MGSLSERLYNYKKEALRIPYYTYLSLWFSLTSRHQFGENVYDRDWDVLFLLDTCRVDALKQVAPEFDFLDEEEIGSIVSVGSGSQEWIANTFTEQYSDDVEDTVYISANGYSRLMLERNEEFPTDRLSFHFADWTTLSADDFQLHHEVWDYAPEMEREGYMDPQIPMDRAISAKRDIDPERLIVHFSRPHDPYANRAIQDDRELEPFERTPFKALERGDVSRETVWDAYLDELRVGLRQVETILESVDADRVAITADHGEAFGEWGVYRHPFLPLPHLRRVPWVVVSAEDTGEYEPEYPLDQSERYDREADEDELQERLRHLGYAG